MAGRGGARPNSGPKKGSHRIQPCELRAALEAKLGISYLDMLAETHLKLFNDFRNDINVKEFLTFTENMSRRLISETDPNANTNPLTELTDQQLALAIKIAAATQIPQPKQVVSDTDSESEE